MNEKLKFIKPLSVTPALVVESNLYTTAPTLWSSATTYTTGQVASVADTLGKINIYKSIWLTGNTNKNPLTEPLYWVYVSSTYELFNTFITYPLGYKVIDPASNKIYESLKSNNYNVPFNTEASPSWVSLGQKVYTAPILWASSDTYSVGDIRRDRVYFPNPFGGADTFMEDIYRCISAYTQTTEFGPWFDDVHWSLAPDVPRPFDPSAKYNTGYVVINTDGEAYRCLRDSVFEYSFNNSSSYWLSLGAANKYAMFDEFVMTGSTANKYITTTVASGIIDSVGLIGVDADWAVVTVRDGLGGTIVFQKTIGLSGGNASNGWDYYWTDPSVRKKQAYIADIPPYLSSHVTLELSGEGLIGIGNFILGKSQELGLPQYGLSSDMLDYSTKTTDSFGRTTFVKRGFKRTMDVSMIIDKPDLPQVESILEDIRATPILVVASEDPDYSETAIRYCFYKSFSTEINYPTFALCNIQFEGLI